MQLNFDCDLKSTVYFCCRCSYFTGCICGEALNKHYLQWLNSYLCWPGGHDAFHQTGTWRAPSVWRVQPSTPLSPLTLAFSAKINNASKQKPHVLSIIRVLRGEARKFCSGSWSHFFTSIFFSSTFSPSNILIWSFSQKLNPATSKPGVLSSHSWKKSVTVLCRLSYAQSTSNHTDMLSVQEAPKRTSTSFRSVGSCSVSRSISLSCPLKLSL